MEKKWWHKTVGYQIYPKSFQDTNGDGIGDLKGVIRHLDKIEKLGANVIWLCPVFASPMVDNGYDISDYMDIDPSFGTMEDMKELIAEAKKRGIRILMDLVVNHSSDRHAWFQAALKDPFGKYGKYYVFREGKDGKEPNNWRSIFGGSAWEKVPGYDNLYYLHIFTKEQPDLNWENPELREEIYEMILKWMDLGLGGFRLDAISHLKKNYQYTNLPPDGPDEYNMAFEYFNNVDGLADILCEMKERTFAPTDALTIGEYDHMGPEDVEDVIGENGSFSSVFDFCHTLDNVRNPKWGNTVALFDDYRDQLFAAQKIVDGRGMLCNFLENHDKTRIIDRFLMPEDQNLYSEKMLPVSIVIVLNTCLNISPHFLSITSSALTTAAAVCSGNFITISSRVFLSVNTRRLFFDFPRFPFTVSISQCPNSSRVSISSGLFSILSPADALACVFLTFLYVRFLFFLTGRFLFVRCRKIPLSI